MSDCQTINCPTCGFQLEKIFIEQKCPRCQTIIEPEFICESCHCHHCPETLDINQEQK